MTAPLGRGRGGMHRTRFQKRKKQKKNPTGNTTFPLSSFFSIASIKDKYVDMLYRKPSQN
jgi:hypothetical protein